MRIIPKLNVNLEITCQEQNFLRELSEKESNGKISLLVEKWVKQKIIFLNEK